MRSRSNLVSVVVTTRNSEDTLARCLQSVRSQTYHPIELIVVDNTSTDATLAIAHKYADAVLSVGPERSAQRNFGAKQSHGELLMFVDSDMELTLTVVADCMNVINLTGATGVIVPEQTVGEGFLGRCRALERSCYQGDDSVEAARFFTASAFNATGGFDEALTGPEDWDLSSRVSGGRPFPRINGYILHHEGRVQLATLLRKKRYYAASWVRYWRKHPNRALGQANLVFRPAYARHWRLLLRHPILTAGFLSLKALETCAAVAGVLETRFSVATAKSA